MCLCWTISVSFVKLEKGVKRKLLPTENNQNMPWEQNERENAKGDGLLCFSLEGPPVEAASLQKSQSKTGLEGGEKQRKHNLWH